MTHSPSRLQEHGQVALLALVFLAIFLVVATAVVSYLTTYARSERIAVASAQALALAEAGIDQAVYQLNQNPSYTGETATALDTGAFTTVVTSIDTNTKRITSTGSTALSTRVVNAIVALNSSVVSFRYAVQVGKGGVQMNNGSQINGNLVSEGSVSGSGTVTGDVIVASSTPPASLSGVTVQGTAHAHSLSSCSIGGDAYYATTNTCVVAGATYPGSNDQEAAPLPISAGQIAEWEAAAAAGGVVNGYSLANNKSGTLGPKKIAGDLSLANGSTLTVTGTLWVEGDVILSNNSTLVASSALGGSGVVLVADDASDPSGSGAIDIQNGVTIAGNGQTGSTFLLVSTNTGSNAISVSNNGNSAILYAPYGTISIQNNTHTTQVTGYRLSLSNNVIVDYDEGFQSQTFTNGPGGSWSFVPGTYGIFR